jgi:hypothetical protein
LRVGSGFNDLSDYQIDLSGYEEGSILGGLDEISSQRYERRDDGSLFVVKSNQMITGSQWKVVELNLKIC